MQEVIIRQPSISDTEDLTRLIEQLGYPIQVEAMRRNLLSYLSLANQKAWVAEVEGTVVGCVAVAITHYLHREGSFLRIIAMCVDQKRRRGGIGRRLMEIAEEYATAMQCSHIELTSGMHRAELGSHEFYRSLGYMELGESKKYFAKKLLFPQNSL